MTQRGSDTLQATCRELDNAGCRYVVERTGSSHYKVLVEGIGPIFCSSTVSDHRAKREARSLVRRLLKLRRAA
jgi:hypothetical protein